jgi:UDP-N-acetylglucosamine--N-acetylmuramyl-(pentapeptide) pyrophosphoryl-undecaprenol N-acetylglucosamine transferase
MASDEYFVPSIIHQLDKVVGMSNQSIAPRTRSVTTSFAYEKEPFPKPVKSRQIPTPVRFGERDLMPKADGARAFDLDPDRPVTLIIGGGTGALSVNEGVRDVLDDLLGVTQVIHVTGKGKRVTDSRPGYYVAEFLSDDLLKAYSAADIVVSRAGMGSVSECTALGKPMVLIPISDNQQEVNAAAMIEGGGAVGLKQDERFKQNLLEILTRLLASEEDRKKLVDGARRVLPTDDGSALAEIVLGLVRRQPAIKSN